MDDGRAIAGVASKVLAVAGAFAPLALLSGVFVQAQEVGWNERLEGEVYWAIFRYNTTPPRPPEMITECLADEGDICWGGITKIKGATTRSGAERRRRSSDSSRG